MESSQTSKQRKVQCLQTFKWTSRKLQWLVFFWVTKTIKEKIIYYFIFRMIKNNARFTFIKTIQHNVLGKTIVKIWLKSFKNYKSGFRDYGFPNSVRKSLNWYEWYNITLLVIFIIRNDKRYLVKKKNFLWLHMSLYNLG